MFWQSLMAYRPNFPVENEFITSEQLNCYKARAEALRPRFPWSEQLLPVWKITLVHLSANVPGKVAYYASVHNLMQNRLTRTSPEMFLQRTLTYAPDVIQAAWASEVLGKTLPEVHFIPNTDADGWYDIYYNGPGSCMAQDDKVRQYAHPRNDLALAYTRNDAGVVDNRVIVNTRTKTYVRVYGRSGVGPFVAALNKLGYHQSNDTLMNQLIWTRYESCRGCGDDVLMGPYLDGDHQCVRVTTGDEGIIGDRGDEMQFGCEAHCGCDEGSDSWDEDDEE